MVIGGNNVIIDNIDFHNVNYKKWDPRYGGWILSRVSKENIEGLNKVAQKTAFYNCGIELRFFMDSEEVNLHFSRIQTPGHVNPQGTVVIFIGDFQASYELSPQYIAEDSVITIRKKYLKNHCLMNKSTGFNPELIRVILPYDWSHCYLGMKGKVRTPTSDDYPQKKILFYGSSIVHGGSSTITTNSYAYKLSQKLNWDYTNLGFAGSCFIEEVMAKEIRKRQWDLLIMELGGNVLDWPEDKFSEKLANFLAIVSKTENRGKIYGIGLFRRITDLNLDKKNENFRKILEEKCAPYEQIEFLNGLDLLTEWKGLSSDGIHPSDYGMDQIYNNLLKELKMK